MSTDGKTNVRDDTCPDVEESHLSDGPSAGDSGGGAAAAEESVSREEAGSGDDVPVDQEPAAAEDAPATAKSASSTDGASPPSGAGHDDAVSVEVHVPDEDQMRALGRRLARFLEPGDLLVLTGKLGAGKTTFVQGLGEGLGVDRPVTSPTFVLARVHASGRVPLVHADAYRLDSIAELDDLDLETPAERSVTVVEWGEGMVEDLADERLDVDIEPLENDVRLVRLTGVGRRWKNLFARGS